MGAAPPDTGTDVAVGTAPGVAAHVVAADPATNMDIDTTDDLFADADDFDSASVWGEGDEIAATIPEAVPTRKRQHMAATQADDTDDGATATAASAVGASPRPTKGRKRTSSRGPAHAARRAAFLAAQEHGTTGAT